MKLKDKKLSLTGEIRLNRNDNYVNFTMKIDDVKNKLSKPLEVIKKNMRDKAMIGTLTMCRFTNYDGN